MFESRQFMVKERVGFMKLVDTYDIFDLASGHKLGIARETLPTFFKILRLLVSKRLLPTHVEVRPGEESPAILTIRRGVGILRTPVLVYDRAGKQIASFKSKLLTLGGGFEVFDAFGRQVAELKGDWKGWNFTLRGTGGEEIGSITKKWGGIGKEVFTSADSYVIALADSAPHSEESAAILLAAGLAIDTVYKER